MTLEREKIRVLNILHHQPPYENYPSDNPPPVHWELSSGEWVGIWGYDIPNQFGDEILKRSGDFIYEVWQPDLRADKIYEHVFSSGVTHILFPAEIIHIRRGLLRKNDVFSRAIIDELKRRVDNRTVIHMNAISGAINQGIIREHHQVPKVINFHSLITSLPYQQMLKLRRNVLLNVQNFSRHLELRRNRRVIYTYNNSRNIRFLKRYPRMGIERVFTSIDFDFWVPGDKQKARDSLGIERSPLVFSMASRLNPHKQVDRVIKVFEQIERETHCDFRLLIAGNGTDEYLVYLRKLAAGLVSRGKVRFVGYIRGNDLLSLYQASDLFISSSVSEGGPASVIKAFACGTPVFCTRTGGVDDYIAESGRGYLAEWNDYEGWQRTFQEILMGRNIPRAFDRETARKLFNWDAAAGKYMEIYRCLADVN